MIAYLSRFDLEEIEMLIAQHKYFILHAPRQTGKTSCMLALMKHLNAKGMTCLYVNVESAQAFRENIKEALTAILSEIASRARSFLNTNYLEDIWYGASEGHLVIFDQRKRKSWKEKIFMRRESINDCEIRVWGV